MGLLDALFPNSDGGGILDFLKHNAMAQGQNFQSGLSSDQAQYGAPAVPAAYQPNQIQSAPLASPAAQAGPGWNSPWPQDNMRWPQGPIGAPSQANAQMPQQAPVPAQPPQVIQAQPAPQAAPIAAPAGPNFFNRAADALASISHGGTMLGAIRGQFDDPINQASAQANLTARALVAKGVDPRVAVAAVQPGNGEMLKTLVTQAFGPHTVTSLGEGYVWDPQQGKAVRAYEPDKEKHSVVKIGQDAMGREQYGTFNQSTGEITPYKAPNSETIGSGIPGDITKTGDEYIASLPKEYQGIVRGFVEGTAQMPRITTKNQQAMQNYFDMAKQADPSFDATNYGARQAGMKSFKSGADAGTVRSANQVLGHISDLTEKADALSNTSYPSLNYVKNTFDTAVGSDAANNWVTQAHAVADELSSFMKGAGHSSDTEIRQWKDSLSPNMSPQQQRGAVKTLMGIYDHALQALEDKRTGAIGPTAAAKAGPLLSSSGREAMDKIRTWAEKGAAQNAPAITEGATATNPKTGQRAVFRGGQWVPMQ